MGEPIKTDMVFVKEECGCVDLKEEQVEVEGQDPLSLEGSSILAYDFMQIYFFISANFHSFIFINGNV